MDNPKEKFLVMTNNLFTFDSYSCDCVTDIENIRPGEVKKTLKIQGLADQPIRFAFAPDKGMVRLAKSGSIDSDRILTQLLSLPENNIDKLFEFFKDYGFFFPISTDEYEAIDIFSLFDLVNRIKAVVFLMNELGDVKKDYKKMLSMVLYLQLKQPKQLSFHCFQEPYVTCQHQLYYEIERASNLPQINNPYEEFNSDSYTIADTIYYPSFQLDIEEYNNIVNGYDKDTPGATQSQFYKNVTRLYRNAPNLSYELRLMIDFLFHYQKNIGIIKSFDSFGKVEYYDTDENIRKRYNLNFDDKMKKALIEIAKITISEELEYNLQGIYPRYDVKTMSPSWAISDMLTGIYFSIFYMRPGLELYRKCENPNCDRWFLVKTTSTKKKYCSSSCSNSIAQRNHRKRKKELEKRNP